MFMICKASGNVKGPLNPLFLTLHPPNYSAKFEKHSRIIFGNIYIGHISKIATFEKRRVLRKSPISAESILGNLKYGINLLKNMKWKLCIFNSTKGIGTSHPPTHPPSHPPSHPSTHPYPPPTITNPPPRVYFPTPNEVGGG